ncbi:hypothetical protein BGX28_003244 [Mortierella sp. GBA30]|nr:hypothetical protein BGX28_003244 [Mortierella sp. GBA30]
MLSGLLNDWDLLLPSSDPYDDHDEHNGKDDDDDDDDDDGWNEEERWKKREMTMRDWESVKGQSFDEQHSGDFVRNYLKGSFFIDMHPPLGKLLFSLIALLFGFDGEFDFALGK